MDASCSQTRRRRPRAVQVYSLVLDLDETLVHYFEDGGGSMGRHEIRPGLQDFLSRAPAACWDCTSGILGASIDYEREKAVLLRLGAQPAATPGASPFIMFCSH